MKCGYDPDAFWDQTPRLLFLAFEAFEERRAIERDDRMSLAWHIALLGRIDPKKFPSHDRLVQRRSNRRKMTPEEQWRVMSALVNTPSSPTRN